MLAAACPRQAARLQEVAMLQPAAPHRHPAGAPKAVACCLVVAAERARRLQAPAQHRASGGASLTQLACAINKAEIWNATAFFITAALIFRACRIDPFRIPQAR